MSGCHGGNLVMLLLKIEHRSRCHRQRMLAISGAPIALHALNLDLYGSGTCNDSLLYLVNLNLILSTLLDFLGLELASSRRCRALTCSSRARLQGNASFLLVMGMPTGVLLVVRLESLLGICTCDRRGLLLLLGVVRDGIVFDNTAVTKNSVLEWFLVKKNYVGSLWAFELKNRSLWVIRTFVLSYVIIFIKRRKEFLLNEAKMRKSLTFVLWQEHWVIIGVI